MADITGTGTLKNFVSYTMDIGDIRKGIKCPANAPLNDWLCVVVDKIIEHVAMVWSCTNEFCTHQSCPTMCAGTRYEYLWPTSPNAPPAKVTAPEYARLVSQWATARMKDPELCPVEAGKPFPPYFQSELTQILKRLFRVYAHIYLHHYRTFIQGGAAEHLNFCFKFFLYAVDEYKLLSDKDMEPLKVIIGIIRKHRDEKDAQQEGGSVNDPALNNAIIQEGVPQQENMNKRD